MSRVLVTGGAGYLGVLVVRELLNRGYAVRVMDKLYFGDETLKRFRTKIELVGGAAGDVRNPSPALFDDVQGVIHLAGLSNDPTAEFRPDINNEMNVEGTRILAQAAIDAGVKRFVFASSASIYDQGTVGSDAMLDEQSPVYPRAAYSVSKYQGEKLLLDLMREHPEFEPVMLRKGTLFGWSPRMRYDLVVNTMVMKALSEGKITVFCGGTQWRPMADVTDAARAYVALIEAPRERVQGEVFNLCQENYRMLDLAHQVSNTLRTLGIEANVTVDPSPDKIDRSYRISGKKIQNAIGFEYRVTVPLAVRELVARIREEGMTDWSNNKYYNIKRMEWLSEIETMLRRIGGVFDSVERPAAQAKSNAMRRVEFSEQDLRDPQAMLAKLRQ